MAEGVNSITLEDCMSRANGITSQVVVILYGLGWIPLNYNKWLDPEGEEWVLTNNIEGPFPVMPLYMENYTYISQETSPQGKPTF